jgi:hypothetical protein
MRFYLFNYLFIYLHVFVTFALLSLCTYLSRFDTHFILNMVYANVRMIAKFLSFPKQFIPSLCLRSANAYITSKT